MILSDRELQNRLIHHPEEITQAIEWWEKGDWGKIGNKMIIDPFNPHALGACCYDLHVGDEYISLRDPDNTKQLKEGERIRIGPGETVLILTEEYICLPKVVLAMIVPRATWIFEGTSICATRIDPTWYGKLLIGFTNLAKNPIVLNRQEAFCTCYFMEASETEKVLTPDKPHFLGRTKIGRIDLTHARQQKLLSPDKVDLDAIEKVVDLYGWPWDVVRGMFVLTQKELGEWIEKEVSSDIVAEATSAAEKRAFEELIKQYSELTRWNRNLIIGILTIAGTIGAGVIAAIVGYLIHLFT